MYVVNNGTSAGAYTAIARLCGRDNQEPAASQQARGTTCGASRNRTGIALSRKLVETDS